MKKLFAVGIIVLFIGIGVIPSTIGTIKEKNVLKNLGSPGYIQDLIDNASHGDTIYIPNGTYYENIVINKSINLIGEDKNTTIIDASGNGTVIKIRAGWVNISGFTIQNSGNDLEDAGVFMNIFSDYNTISGNYITKNFVGIYLLGSSYNKITYNIISFNFRSIGIVDESGPFGGVFESDRNNIFRNNILKNQRGPIFSYLKGIRKNTWRDNYWNRPRVLPKFIFGVANSYPLIIPWFEIDWCPAKEQYDI